MNLSEGASDYHRIDHAMIPAIMPRDSILTFNPAFAVTVKDIEADIEPSIKLAGHRAILRDAMADLRARHFFTDGLLL